MWALLYLIGALVVLYVSFNFETLSNEYGSLIVIAVPLLIVVFFVKVNKDLVWRVKNSPPN